jgi:prepilin-type processing-associated H-X9-DG protein
MSRRRYWDLGCLLGMAGFTALIVYPVFSRAYAKAAQAACHSNLEQLTLSVRIYGADHDERLPNMLLWAPTLRECYKAEHVLLCPGDSRMPLDRFGADAAMAARTGFLSYDMLQRWSYHRLPPQAQAERAIVLYEVGRKGLEYRHLGGMNVGFLDGHQKYYLASELTPAMILSGTR